VAAFGGKSAETRDLWDQFSGVLRDRVKLKAFGSVKGVMFQSELMFRLKESQFLLWVPDKQPHQCCKMNIFGSFEFFKKHCFSYESLVNK
jgi:hypothetical protein